VQQPYGRYQLEPTSPTSVESMRMITLRIKLDTNIVQGETERRLVLCGPPSCFFQFGCFLMCVTVPGSRFYY